MKFVVKKTSNGEFRFNVLATNGQPGAAGDAQAVAGAGDAVPVAPGDAQPAAPAVDPTPPDAGAAS